MNVLIYIAGYVARSVSKRVHCQYCACHLCLENDLNVELQSSEYFNLLDRGGLKWPTNFVMTSCVNTYCIFEQLISKFEQSFCNHSRQKMLLTKLSLQFFSPLFENEECSCGKSLHLLLNISIQVMCNILLNNYAKNKNDIISQGVNERRKLQTLFRT